MESVQLCTFYLERNHARLTRTASRGNTCVNGQCQQVAPSSDCKTDSDCKQGQTCQQGKCKPVAPPTSGCGAGKECASDESCICKKNSKVYCNDNSECATNACGLVTDNPNTQCCVGHVYKNTNNQMICSLEKGNDCSGDDNYCTSYNCQAINGNYICV